MELQVFNSTEFGSVRTATVTPHLLYPQFMDDGNDVEREMAMHFNYVLLGKCTELWVFGGVVSRGMAREIGVTDKESFIKATKMDHVTAKYKERFKVREIKTSKDIRDWNNGEIPIAVIHPASAGHGLNLQSGGSTLIWFGLTWSLELYQQTNARLWKQGQKFTVIKGRS